MRIHRVYSNLVCQPNDIFELEESESKHLLKSLRLEPGAKINVFDGKGYSALCEILNISKKKCTIKRIAKVIKQDQPVKIISAVAPLIKRVNFNFMIQKLTEVGVNSFHIYKPDLIDQSLAKKNFENIVIKIEEIIVNVCKQCGNDHLPKINLYRNIHNAIENISDHDIIFSFDTKAKKLFSQTDIGEHNSVGMITGPESGFSNEELEEINSKNIKLRFLGDNILRAETAPIMVSSIIKNHFVKIEP